MPTSPYSPPKQAGGGPDLILKVNSHVHLQPNFSAFRDTDQALRQCAEQGIAALGVSNYYDYQVYRSFAERAREQGIFPLFGLEVICLIDSLRDAGVKINDPGNPGKMYLCGKGITEFDPPSTEALQLLHKIRDADSNRAAAMVTQLSNLFSARGVPVPLTAQSIRTAVANRTGLPLQTIYLQERHIAQAFQEALFERSVPAERVTQLEQVLGATPKSDPGDAAGVQNELRSHLMKAGKPGYVEETFVGFDHARALVLALGGIPCYPTLADGAGQLCGYEDPPEDLAARLRTLGVHCAELIPNRNSPESLERFAAAFRRTGLIVLAGTEHNTLEMLPMEPQCLGGVPVPDHLKQIFYEGACVVAAHQDLVARGEAGFVDRHGTLHRSYTDDEERIASFKAIGDAVIRGYRKRGITAQGPGSA